MFLTSSLVTPCSHLLLPYIYLLFTNSAVRVNDPFHAATTDEVCLATTVNARLRPECVWEVPSKTETHYLDGEYLEACAKRLHVGREYVSRTRCFALAFCLPQVSRRY